MSRFTGLGAVFRREFKSYFSSPLGYVFIVIFLVASGYLTVSRDFGRFLEIRQANLDAFFLYIPWIFVILVPAVAMRLWAEERKSGTLELRLSVNGQLRQQSNTRDLILGVAELVEYTSSFYTLYPGDVVFTGTPAGVGPIQPGDTLTACIDRIGTMQVDVRA